MRNYLVSIAIVISANVSADVSCTWEGRELKQDETVYVQDPKLVLELTEHLEKEGRSHDNARKEALRDDWVGYRLQCVSAFVPATDSTKPIQLTGGVMVLVDHQRSWYTSLNN